MLGVMGYVDSMPISLLWNFLQYKYLTDATVRNEKYVCIYKATNIFRYVTASVGISSLFFVTLRPCNILMPDPVLRC